MVDDAAAAKKIIQENIYCTIATASLDGKPWISPLFFAYDDHYNVYWVSAKDSLHSRLIRLNPRAAITFFDTRTPEGLGVGVYMDTHVEELAGEQDIQNAMTVYNDRVTKDEFKVKTMSEVTGSGLWRIYKATPVKTSILTEAGEIINGQYIDTKVEIQL